VKGLTGSAPPEGNTAKGDKRAVASAAAGSSGTG